MTFRIHSFYANYSSLQNLDTLLCTDEKQFLQYLNKFGKNIENLFFQHSAKNSPKYHPLSFILRYAYPLALQQWIEQGLSIQAMDTPLIPLVCSYIDHFDSYFSQTQIVQDQKNKVKVLQLLLENGAAINQKDAKGQYALDYLFEYQPIQSRQAHYWNYIYLLIKAGEDLKLYIDQDKLYDERLQKYLNDEFLMKICPLASHEIHFLRVKIQETLTLFTVKNLYRLAKQVKSSLSQVIWWEERLFDRPYEFFENSRHHHSPSDVTLRIIQYKKETLEHMQLLKQALNSCAQQLAPFRNNEREKIDTIVHYVTQGFIPKKQLKNAHLLPEAFQRLIHSIIQKPSVDNEQATLLPSSFFSQKKTSLISYKKMDEELTDELNQRKLLILNHLKTLNSDNLSCIDQHILAYLKGHRSLKEFSIHSENGRAYLEAVKIIDLALSECPQKQKEAHDFIQSSYVLRTHILEICSPFMTTSEAYTKTLDPKKMKDRAFLSYSYHWIPERVGQQAKIISNQTILIAYQSQQLNYFSSRIEIARGNTGVGKTHFFHNKNSQQITRVLNPDHIKYPLKKKEWRDSSAFLTNFQVHEEGVTLFKSFLQGIKKDSSHANLSIEGRFSTLEDLNTNALKLALKHQSKVHLLDIESSLMASLYRVLQRDPFGNDPCPPLKEIIKGYRESIIYREQLILSIKKQEIVNHFNLYVYDSQGCKHLTAQKKQNRWIVFRDDLLKKSLTLLSEKDIQNQIHQKINSSQIEYAIQQGYLLPQNKHLIEKWIGCSLAKAVDMHAMGISASQAIEWIQEEKNWREKYGTFELQPFDGAWLKDFPFLVSHLQSEQLLHIRGTDEEGEGLHWQTNKFAWNLNPQFNPESKLDLASRGGFQMKIGYFIIPLKYMDCLKADSLSFTILKELEVTDGNGQHIGYRFFVHPEAYEHFKALHDAQIPFIQPAYSEFMGTPTSSYRSWVVRRVEKHNLNQNHPNLPFIIKLGVSSSSTDTSRLLSRPLIEKSLQSQKMIEQTLKKPSASTEMPLLFFPETLGMILKDIPHYPPAIHSGNGEPIHSGMIIREIPTSLLKNQCQIFSFSALMSVERGKKDYQGICSLPQNEVPYLPLIYEIMHATLLKGLVKSSEEFMTTYFIKGYLKAIKHLHFEQGFPFAPHGQNLCLVVNQDYIPQGFAYRDLEGISFDQTQGYLETFSWFYRYHIFIKLLNVTAHVRLKKIPPPKGAPLQKSCLKPLSERMLCHTILHQMTVDKKINVKALMTFSALSLTLDQYHQLLNQLDQNYLTQLAHYFDVDQAQLLQTDGSLLSGEAGAFNATQLKNLNTKLWKHRYTSVPFMNIKPKQNLATPLFHSPFSKQEQQVIQDFLAVCDRVINNGNYDPRPTLITLAENFSSLLSFTVNKKIPDSKIIQNIEVQEQILVAQEAKEKAQTMRKKAIGSIRTLHDLKYNYEYEPIHQIPDEFFSDLLRAAKRGDCQEVEKQFAHLTDKDQKEMQSARSIAIIFGQLEIVKFLVKKGVKLQFEHPYNLFKDAYIERWTSMGLALKYRQEEIVAYLLQQGCPIDNISYEEHEQGALNLFFRYRDTQGPHPRLLKLILEQKPKLSEIESSTIFNIAVHSNVEELKLLLEAGFSPKTCWRQETNPDYKEKKVVGYSSEVNLLDLAVMEAERQQFFGEHTEAIEKVRVLIQYGADPKTCNNFCNQNYLHRVSHPELVQLFCELGIDPTAKALTYTYSKEKIKPIARTCDLKVIDLLCQYGERRDHSPYLKGTLAHDKALERIDYFRKPMNGQILKNVDFLIRATQFVDIPALIALIGEGVDVNERRQTNAQWTVLHSLFAEFGQDTISKAYDYLHFSENIQVWMIDLLIKQGALPLKDAVGRTPLMCLTFHPFDSRCNHLMMKKYVAFEANYYQLDPQEYWKKLLKLREGGFRSVDTFLSGSMSVPIQKKFDQFWQSFQTHEPFKPKVSHHPHADWLKMRAIFND